MDAHLNTTEQSAGYPGGKSQPPYPPPTMNQGSTAPPYPPENTHEEAPQHTKDVPGSSPAQLYPGGQLQQSSLTMVGNPWSTGLFDCEQDQTSAVMTAFFPCVAFGQNVEILDEGGTSCSLGSFMYIVMVPALLSCWILGSNYRKKLRDKYNLVQAPAEDWTVHLFCPCCALCQESRELKNQGIDPTLGWMGYLAQKQKTTTTPPKNQFISK